MCLFIETICYEQGYFQRIDLHNDRFNRTRNHFFGEHSNIQLELFLSVPVHLKDKTLKCRVTYGRDILNIEYDLYNVKTIKSLQLIVDDLISYSFKYADRTKLTALYDLKGHSDDILIVKDGFITDTSSANIVFNKGGKWYSPQNPLLRGTRLESYIREGRVTPALLHPKDLPLFNEARIINAMVSIENSFVIPISNIID